MVSASEKERVGGIQESDGDFGRLSTSPWHSRVTALEDVSILTVQRAHIPNPRIHRSETRSPTSSPLFLSKLNIGLEDL